MTLRLACIADDLTGATDLANEICRSGLRTIVVTSDDGWSIDDDVAAVVVALKSRSIPAAEAVTVSLDALARLERLSPGHVYFKYCSTFDSTDDGNIGPVLEALVDARGATIAIACPAFPENGRTVVHGHLFVGHTLLERSGMRHHPLNPMTNSDLVQVLAAQSRSRVGLLSFDSILGDRVEEALAGLASEGFRLAIADALDGAMLDRLGETCSRMPLSSGASGLGAGIARHFAPSREAEPFTLPCFAGRALILSGSCSGATLAQVEHARSHIPVLNIGGHLDMQDAAIVALAAEWIERHDSATPVLVCVGGNREEVADTRRRHGEVVGRRLESLLAAIACTAVDRGCDRLVVAGGETSGEVVAALGVEAMRIGPQIAPGVPWTHATRADGRSLALALKSGNFGQPTFFLDAWNLLP